MALTRGTKLPASHSTRQANQQADKQRVRGGWNEPRDETTHSTAWSRGEERRFTREHLALQWTVSIHPTIHGVCIPSEDNLYGWPPQR